jgi:hypothetical protein
MQNNFVGPSLPKPASHVFVLQEELCSQPVGGEQASRAVKKPVSRDRADVNFAHFPPSLREGEASVRVKL